MDTLEMIGKLAPEGAQRDAVHFAVIPMVAGCPLNPGDGVKLRNGSAVYAEKEHAVGIVDPFLRGRVSIGNRFWLFLMPCSITSLRHVWTHPSFKEEGVVGVSVRTESEAWMRKWATEHVGYDYYGNEEDKVDEESAYQFAIRAGYDHSLGPYESARDCIDDEWWGHWEAITGQKGDRSAYFSCAC